MEQETEKDISELSERDLQEKIYETFVVLVDSVNKLHKEWRTVLATKRFTAFLLVVMFVLVIALQVQVFTRNNRLDKFNDKLTELKTSTKKIEKVADQVQEGNPEQTAAVENLFRQVNQICEAVN